MAEVSLEFIGRELHEIRVELREMRTDVRDLRADLKVLTGIVLGLAREMEHVKEMLGRMDARISKLEGAQ